MNKVSTRIELFFDVDASINLSGDEKILIRKKLANKISSDGVLRIVSQAGRSQLENKEKAIEKFYSLIEKSLKKLPPRKPTKPRKGAKEKRLKDKKEHSEKKKRRTY